MNTWEQLKTLSQILYSQYVGNGKLIDDTNGNPTALALLVSLVHNKIANFPQDFECLKETATITLNGSTSYNLATLFPDLKSVYQIYGIYQNCEHQFLPNNIANVTAGEGYTLKDKILTFTGSIPTSGTANIQYKSKWLVKNSTGTRKQYFENDSDYSVLDNQNLEAFGIGEFIQWKADTKSADRKNDIKSWFKDAWDELVLDNIQTKQIDSIL